MTAEIIIAVTASVFLILSIFLFCGKGSWLIAGFNTASPEEKAKYDIKKLCRAAGIICLTVSVMLYIMAYLGYRVDSGRMSENAMLPFALVFAAIVLTSVGLSIAYMNTKAKK